jgi:hypothetical protein
LRTNPCGPVISSGITCPFGQLSQSPGYISDTLLTLAPLTLAGPCDLHVLTTPPAFRLSQDQTLQFNFLARPILLPCVEPRIYMRGSDRDLRFHGRVCPRNESVLTKSRYTKNCIQRTWLLLPIRRLWRLGQSASPKVLQIDAFYCIALPHSKTAECKAQTPSLAGRADARPINFRK